MASLKSCKTHELVQRELKRITKEFLRTGLAYVCADHTDRSVPTILKTKSVNSYLRAVAKEAGMPLVVARRTDYYPWLPPGLRKNGKARDRSETRSYIELTVPVGPKYSELLRPLDLIASDYSLDALCWYGPTLKSVRYIHFQRAGVEAFEGFRARLLSGDLKLPRK